MYSDSLVDCQTSMPSNFAVISPANYAITAYVDQIAIENWCFICDAGLAQVTAKFKIISKNIISMKTVSPLTYTADPSDITPI